MLLLLLLLPDFIFISRLTDMSGRSATGHSLSCIILTSSRRRGARDGPGRKTDACWEMQNPNAHSQTCHSQQRLMCTPLLKAQRGDGGKRKWMGDRNLSNLFWNKNNFFPDLNTEKSTQTQHSSKAEKSQQESASARETELNQWSSFVTGSRDTAADNVLAC